MTLRINTSAEECGKCAIAALCAKNSDIDVSYPDPSPDLVGKQVTIEIKPKAQRHALALFFVIPLVIILGIVPLAMWLGASQPLAAGIAVAVVAVWFLAVWAINRRGKLSDINIVTNQ